MYLYKNCFLFWREIIHHQIIYTDLRTPSWKRYYGFIKIPPPNVCSNLLIFHLSTCTHKISINFRMLFHRGNAIAHWLNGGLCTVQRLQITKTVRIFNYSFSFLAVLNLIKMPYLKSCTCIHSKTGNKTGTYIK